MPFKYEAELRTITNCPTGDFAERESEAYRFIFRENPLDSFLPALARSPKRALKWDETQRCSGWALSFYTSITEARAQFEALQRVNPKIHKALGDSVAFGQLAEADGVSCLPDGTGHFELHEYTDTELTTRFSLVEVLV